MEHKYDYKILSKTDYLAGKATKNGSTDSIKTARNSESIEKLLTNIINNVIKNEYEPFLEEYEIKDKEVLVFQLDKIKSQYDDKSNYNLNIENLSFSSDKFKMSAKNLKTELDSHMGKHY